MEQKPHKKSLNGTEDGLICEEVLQAGVVFLDMNSSDSVFPSCFWLSGFLHYSNFVVTWRLWPKEAENEERREKFFFFFFLHKEVAPAYLILQESGGISFIIIVAIIIIDNDNYYYYFKAELLQERIASDQ